MELLCLLLAVGSLFLFLAVSESDVKRWLAYLSLAHITMVPIFLRERDLGEASFPLLFSLGHSMSASVGFIIYWFITRFAGRRSFQLSKRVVPEEYMHALFLTLTMSFLGSLPFGVQFFRELALFVQVTVHRVFFRF